MGVPVGELLSRFQSAVRCPLPWVEVNDAPVQEQVHRKVDLLKLLPIPKHNEHDSGPYITAALLIARNPKTGVQNVSIHRCQISGPDRIGVLLLPRHTRHYFSMAEREGTGDSAHLPSKFKIVVARAHSVLMQDANADDLQNERERQKPAEPCRPACAGGCLHCSVV